MKYRWNFTIFASNGNRKRIREFLNSKKDSVTIHYIERRAIGKGKIGIGPSHFMGHIIGEHHELESISTYIKSEFNLRSFI